MDLLLGRYHGHHAPKGYAGTSRNERRNLPPLPEQPCVIPFPTPPPKPPTPTQASSHAHRRTLAHATNASLLTTKRHMQIFHHINYYAVLIPAYHPFSFTATPSPPQPKRKTTGCFYLYMLAPPPPPRHAPHAPCRLITQSHIPPAPKKRRPCLLEIMVPSSLVTLGPSLLRGA